MLVRNLHDMLFQGLPQDLVACILSLCSQSDRLAVLSSCPQLRKQSLHRSSQLAAVLGHLHVSVHSMAQAHSLALWLQRRHGLVSSLHVRLLPIQGQDGSGHSLLVLDLLQTFAAGLAIAKSSIGCSPATALSRPCLAADTQAAALQLDYCSRARLLLRTPHTWGGDGLRKLQVLSKRGAPIEVPRALSQLSRLTSLTLAVHSRGIMSCCNLVVLEPGCLPKELQELVLEDPSATCLPGAVLRATQLQRLKLLGSRAYGLDTSGLERLSKLSSLSLSCCSLPGMPPQLSRLTALHSLDLSCCHFKAQQGVDWGLLAGLTQLEWLSLAACPFRSLADNIWHLPMLKELDLGLCPLNHQQRPPSHPPLRSLVAPLDFLSSHVTWLSSLHMLRRLGLAVSSAEVQARQGRQSTREATAGTLAAIPAGVGYVSGKSYLTAAVGAARLQAFCSSRPLLQLGNQPAMVPWWEAGEGSC